MAGLVAAIHAALPQGRVFKVCKREIFQLLAPKLVDGRDKASRDFLKPLHNPGLGYSPSNGTPVW
jgi:hypothetical protein